LQVKWKWPKENRKVFMTSRIGCWTSRIGCWTSRIGCRASRTGYRTSCWMNKRGYGTRGIGLRTTSKTYCWTSQRRL
jgi:hypothetical protein